MLRVQVGDDLMRCDWVDEKCGQDGQYRANAVRNKPTRGQARRRQDHPITNGFPTTRAEDGIPAGARQS